MSDSNDTPGELPFSANINWAQLLGLVASVTTLFGLPLSPDLQKALAAFIVAAIALYTVVAHTFFNHPKNVAIVRTMVRQAVIDTRRGGNGIVTLFVIGMALMTLGGCSTLAAIAAGQSLQQGAPQTMAQAEKALTVAHLAYQGLGHTILDATHAGLIKGATAALVQHYYDQAGGALDLADQADDAANVKGIAAQISTAEALIANASNLINPPKH